MLFNRLKGVPESIERSSFVKFINPWQISVVVMFVLGLCCASELPSKTDSAGVQEQSQIAKTNIGSRPPTSWISRDPRIGLINIYQSKLKKNGINDYSADSLITLLDDERPSIRQYSVIILGEMKERSAIPKLEEKLNDISFPVLLATVKALLRMGNRKGIPVFKEYSDVISAEFDAGEYKNMADLKDALSVLADAGEVSAIPHLRKLLKYYGVYDLPIRRQAVRLLGKLHSKDSTVIKDIESMLNDELPEVRQAAAAVLKKIKTDQLKRTSDLPEKKDAAKTPIRMCNKHKTNWQEWYQNALEELGVDDFSSDSLIKLLGNENSMIRYSAAALIGEKKILSAIPKLELLLDDNSMVVMRSASKALSKMGNRKGIIKLEKYCEKTLKEIKESKDYRLRTQKLLELSNSLKVLAEAGELSAIPYLKEMLKNNNSRMRLSALRSLGKLQSKDSTITKYIESMLTDGQPGVRRRAAQILEKCCGANLSPNAAKLIKESKERAAILRLEKKLNDPSIYNRLSATRSLLKEGNRKGIPVLKADIDSVSAEIDAGNYKNIGYLSSALSVLADAGEVSAVGHLRKLVKYSGVFNRVIKRQTVRSLGKLHSKDSTVTKDIESMLNDEHPLVREAAAEFLKNIKANQ